MLQVRLYAGHVCVLHQLDLHGRRGAHRLLQYIGRLWLILVRLILRSMQPLPMFVHVGAAEERHGTVWTGVQNFAGVRGCVFLWSRKIF